MDGITLYDEIPINCRIGILDRKLRVVNENTDTEEDWMNWCIRAFQSVYGYEFQGDNREIIPYQKKTLDIEYKNMVRRHGILVYGILAYAVIITALFVITSLCVVK